MDGVCSPPPFSHTFLLTSQWTPALLSPASLPPPTRSFVPLLHRPYLHLHHLIPSLSLSHPLSPASAASTLSSSILSLKEVMRDQPIHLLLLSSTGSVNIISLLFESLHTLCLLLCLISGQCFCSGETLPVQRQK